eukprot:2773240-Prymnesium_polylepis.2
MPIVTVGGLMMLCGCCFAVHLCFKQIFCRSLRTICRELAPCCPRVANCCRSDRNKRQDEPKSDDALWREERVANRGGLGPFEV